MSSFLFLSYFTRLYLCGIWELWRGCIEWRSASREGQCMKWFPICWVQRCQFFYNVSNHILTPRKACKSQQWKVTSKEKLLTIWSKLAFCIKFLVAFPKMIWFGKVSSFSPKLLPKPVIFWQIFWQFATLQICHWANYPQLLRIKLPILESSQPRRREN